MKYCLIHNLYPPYAVGGAERVVEAQARDLLSQGHEVVVITTKPWDSWGCWKPTKTVEGGITAYRFWPPNIFSYQKLSKYNVGLKLLWHALNAYNRWSTRIVQKIFQEEKPDAVWTHNLIGVGFGIPRLARKLKIAHTHFLHDVQLVEPSGVLAWNHTRDTVFQKIYSSITKKKFGSPTHVVSFSDFLKHFYQTRGFFPKSDWRVETSLTKKTTPRHGDRFLFVGSLVPHKGIQVLMRAWDALPKNFDGMLRIVGDGKLRPEVVAWAQKKTNVVYCGRLEGQELENIFQTHDVVLFPSVCIENRPRVIEEAQARGLWVLASRTGGVPELVEEGTNGSLVEPGDTGRWAAAIHGRVYS